MISIRRACTFLTSKTQDDEEYETMMEKGRKVRVMMRGIKIGRKKGGNAISIMSIYEKKKDVQ